MKKHLVLILIVYSVFISACEADKSPQQGQGDLRVNTPDVGISFPPVKNINQIDFSLDKLNDLKVNHIRFAENWKYREPSKGQFKWESLDTRIEKLNTNNIKFLLTIQSNGPDWIKNNSAGHNNNSIAFNESNNTDFVHYLTLLLQRYDGKISEIQFGNEWQTQWWYAANAEHFTTTHNLFYNTVKDHNPEIKVVLGGFSIGALRIIAASQGLIQHYRDEQGELVTQEKIQQLLNSSEAKTFFERIHYVLDNAHYDALDIHLYDDYENWPHYLSAINALKPNKNVVVSEFGGPNTRWSTYSDALHNLELAQYLNTINTLNIDYALYFKLVEDSSANHSRSGLIDNNLNIKPGYQTFKLAIENQ
jgi:hypothetical protein